MKKHVLLLALILALAAPMAHAQPGCEDSPENPTIILAGLAGGAYAVSAIVTRVRARRGNKSR